MPYITKDRQLAINKGEHPKTEGELNYAISVLLDEYVMHHGLKYRTLNDVMGALSGADKEFYRRVVAPYEDTKIERNGDVYRCVSLLEDPFEDLKEVA